MPGGGSGAKGRVQGAEERGMIGAGCRAVAEAVRQRLGSSEVWFKVFEKYNFRVDLDLEQN